MKRIEDPGFSFEASFSSHDSFLFERLGDFEEFFRCGVSGSSEGGEASESTAALVSFVVLLGPSASAEATLKQLCVLLLC